MDALAQVGAVSAGLVGLFAVGFMLALRCALYQQHRGPGFVFDCYRAITLASGLNCALAMAMMLDPRAFADDYQQTFLGGTALWFGPGFGVTFFLTERLKDFRGRHPLHRRSAAYGKE